MFKLILALLIVCSSQAFAAGQPTEAEIAVLVARAYVVGSKFQLDGKVEDELYEPVETTASGFKFIVLDASGDCALTVVVKRDGSIDQNKTTTFCN